MAMMANISILAPLLGPLAGALFVHYLNWRFIFVIIGFFALIALWGLWQYMPESVGQTKRDGELIPRVMLEPRIIWGNYKKLLTNPVFMLSSIAFGLVGLPCVAWIGLAPIILVTVGQQTLIGYGLWQLPVFSAIIAGNMVLHRMTHHYSLQKLLIVASGFVALGLFLVYGLLALMGEHFTWLIPGLMVYFFGLGMAGSPLSRFILFSTPVAKGTASALMSMILMSVQALGIQIANALYATHNNLILGLYCVLVSCLYMLVMAAAFWLNQKKA